MATSGLEQEYLSCSYESWSIYFQHFVHDNIVIPVPDNIFLYLMSDVMVLPKNSVFGGRSTSERNGIWSSAEEELEEPEFFDFDEKLRSAIRDLGGKVFIKLNWSAPKDSSWITSTRSLCCSDPADIYLLLKSSTCISNDLSMLKKDSESENVIPCYLVLKKWEEIHPGTEYRCFVMNKNIAGICQRDTTSYFKYIGENKDSIAELITNFFHNNIKKKFSLKTYILDIVILPGKKIILIDFGVLNKDTDCLLFSWKELKEKQVLIDSKMALTTSLKSEKDGPPHLEEKDGGIQTLCKEEFRYIDEFTNVSQNRCKHYGIPVDIMHFCSGKKSVADFIQEEIINNSL